MRTLGYPGQTPAAKPRFGCRVFAYMTEKPDGSQNKLLRDCLLNSPLSLKRRSLVPPPEARKISMGGWVGKPEHADGWGLAAYRDHARHPFKIKKSPQAAGTDPLFIKAVKAFIHFHPRVLLGHIRSGENPTLENAHPFMHKEWTMMHNGYVDGVSQPPIRDNVQRHFPNAIKGTTDTEQLFYHFLAKLQDSGKTSDTHTPEGVKNVLTNFMQAVLEAKVLSTSQSLKATDFFQQRFGIPLVPGSEISTGQAANVVASNGHMLMATKSGRSLYLGARQNASGGKEVLLASEEIPTKLPNGNVTWLEIPEDHLVAVWPDAQKHLQVLLTPFEKVQDTLAAMTPKA